VPEVHFTVRWPDGLTEECYSPSTIIGERVEAGVPYPVADFVARASEALRIGSDRVHDRYGFHCGHAALQIATFAEREREYAGGVVVVEGFR